MFLQFAHNGCFKMADPHEMWKEKTRKRGYHLSLDSIAKYEWGGPPDFYGVWL